MATQTGSSIHQNPLPAGVPTTYNFAPFSVNTSGDSANNVIVAAPTAGSIKIVALVMSAPSNVVVTPRDFDGASTYKDLCGAINMLANAPVVLPYNDAGWFKGVATHAIELGLGGAVAVSGVAVYVVE